MTVSDLKGQFLFLRDQRVSSSWRYYLSHVSQDPRLPSGGYVEFVRIQLPYWAHYSYDRLSTHLPWFTRTKPTGSQYSSQCVVSDPRKINQVLLGSPGILVLGSQRLHVIKLM